MRVFSQGYKDNFTMRAFSIRGHFLHNEMQWIWEIDVSHIPPKHEDAPISPAHLAC